MPNNRHKTRKNSDVWGGTGIIFLIAFSGLVPFFLLDILSHVIKLIRHRLLPPKQQSAPGSSLLHQEHFRFAVEHHAGKLVPPNAFDGRLQLAFGYLAIFHNQYHQVT